MAKPKLADVKKYLGEMNEAELRAELLKLFGKLPQVQEFYAQELMGESERKAMLDEYRKKIYGSYFTRTDNPRDVNNAELRKLLTAFEKVSVFPHEVVDLLLYRVEVATDFANQFGGMPDADYNAALTSFEKAMKLAAEHQLADFVRDRCHQIFKANNLDYWYIEWMQDCFANHIGK
jgi:hypothetical protein